MNYKIETLPHFDKDVKKLKKRFPKIKDDLISLIKALQENPKTGTYLEEGFYKIRLQNSSVPTGKSGGFRVISYFLDKDIIYLITMYSKSDKDTILIDKLKEIIRNG